MGANSADGCEAYLDLADTGDGGMELGEAFALQKECEDDITLGWATMISGIVLVIGVIVMGIIAVLYDGTKSIVNHNQKIPLGDSPRPPKE